MAYTLELYFTGMCTFVVDPETQEHFVVLVNATNPGLHFPDPSRPRPSEHQPKLIVPIEYRAQVAGNRDSGVTMHPDPQGRTLLEYDLSGDDFTLELGDEPNGVEIIKAPTSFPADQVPNALNAKAFDWVADLPGKLRPEVFAPDLNRDLLAARLKFRDGALSTQAHSLDNLGFPLTFRFSDAVTAPQDSAPSRSIADFVVLRVSNVFSDRVVFKPRAKSGRQPIILTARSGETIRASLTNFDVKPSSINCTNNEPVADFLWYSRLIDNNRLFLIPWPDSVTSPSDTPSCSCCPPTKSSKQVAQPQRAVTANFKGPGAPFDTEELLGVWKELGGSEKRFGELQNDNEFLLKLSTQVDGKDAMRVTPQRPFGECVALLGNSSGRLGFLGSGIAIHKRAVLTAAHVLHSSEGDGLSVAIGNSIEVPLLIKVQHPPIFAEHNLGRPHFSADLALLILDTDIPGLEVPPIRDAKPGDAVLVGFGKNPALQLGHGFKQEAEINITKIPFEPKPAVVVRKNTFEMLSSRKTGMACPGDSGGGLYQNASDYADRVLVGIHSRPKDPLDPCKSDGISVRLEPYREWIKNTLEAQGLT